MARSSRIDRLEQGFPEAEVDKLYKEGRERVAPALDKFFRDSADTPGVVASRWSDIRQMILNVDARIHYWENRRTQFLQLAVALLAAAAAATVAMLANIDLADWSDLQHVSMGLRFLPILTPCVAFLFGAVGMLMIWNRQNNPSYPFTKAYRTWRWQYRHAEKNPIDADFGRYDRDRFQEQVRCFADNLVHYKIKTLESKPQDLLDQDLSQLFLLLINEKFKIKCVSRLRDSLVHTANSALAIGLVTSLVVVLYVITAPW